jgi:hypothetical protein
VKHDLDQATAHKAAEKAWESYSQRFADYKPRIEWTTNTHANIAFSVKGVSLKGAIDLEPQGIALELDVPFVFRIFKKQAVNVIEGEIETWIARAKAGEI